MVYISPTILLRKPTQIRVIISRSQIDSAAYSIIVFTTIAERIGIISTRIVFNTKRAVGIGLGLCATCIGEDYYIPMRVEVIVRFASIIGINQVYTSDVNRYTIPFNIRNDIRSIPKMNGIANTVSQSIGSVRIIGILNSVICVAILRTEKSIGIACNKRAV